MRQRDMYRINLRKSKFKSAQYWRGREKMRRAIWGDMADEVLISSITLGLLRPFVDPVAHIMNKPRTGDSTIIYNAQYPTGEEALEDLISFSVPDKTNSSFIMAERIVGNYGDKSVENLIAAIEDDVQ